jgi:hypothetical protein
MKTPNQPRTLSISVSLVIMALGFSDFGFLSFINTQPGYTSSIFSAEHAYSLIGRVLVQIYKTVCNMRI